MKRTATIITLTALALASCGGGSDDAADTTESAETSAAPSTTTTVPPTTTIAPTTTAATTTTSTSTTTTTVDPIAAAGAQYIALVTPANCTNELLNLMINDAYGDEYLSENEWVAAQPGFNEGFQAAADRSLEFMNGLIAYDWPDEVQSDVDALVAELAADAAIYQQTADAATFDGFLTVPALGQGGAATVLRAKLGLESNIGTDTISCEAMSL